jgi:fibro-slime domain-containing protein
MHLLRSPFYDQLPLQLGAAGAFAILFACGGSTPGESRASGSTTTIASGPQGVGGGIINTGSGTGGAGGTKIPPLNEFTMTEVGGYKLGQPLMGAGVTDTGLGGTDCGIVVGVVRDFKGKTEGGHPDFESYGGADTPTLALVDITLGSDQKPVYASQCETPAKTAACPWGQMTSGKANFDQWYRFTDGVNKPYLLYLLFKPMGGIATFNSRYFFPVDNAGWGGSAVADDFKPHNFSFTTELHTKFKYNGGETFQFEGDDDLWVFINGKRVIDLGGLHSPAKGMVNLDASATALGLTKGGTYLLELFHAERHTSASHFRVDTTLTFVDCGIIPPDVQ